MNYYDMFVYNFTKEQAERSDFIDHFLEWPDYIPDFPIHILDEDHNEIEVITELEHMKQYPESWDEGMYNEGIEFKRLRKQFEEDHPKTVHWRRAIANAMMELGIEEISSQVMKLDIVLD
ncbi:hypothetical protein PL222_00755 [Salmonella enterica]|uniref:hypothetical protein n=1 Tax=Salmonella enterica TaxID=28901 RepID=UPI0026DCBBCD|nr:hypothetical protein [Salmonella enterica]MDO3814227.1 hypothetical protein [Salmonella enterica]MDO3823281.1 hypothetical protein [Salmonella enterica]